MTDRICCKESVNDLHKMPSYFETVPKDKELSDVLIDETLLIGSWLDSSESVLHFSIFQDGTAHSDNMEI